MLRNFKTVLWPQAYRTQDAELLDRLLHDSFEMIDNDGTGVAEAYTYKSSSFLIKEEGVWKAIASHVSGYRPSRKAE